MIAKKIRTQLSIMMFLQFFIWGAWFVTLGQCLGTNGLVDAIGGAYGTAPIAAIFAPLFLGIVADRFFASEKVMGILLLLGGVLMCLAPGFAVAHDSKTLVWLFTGHMLCYMPTLALGNNIAFANITDQNQFPKIRVWGTIGWIAAGLAIGFLGWSAKFHIFWLAGICSLLLGVYSFFLPNTPPPARGKPVNVRALLMVDALSLLKKPAFLVFIVASTLICVPLAYYYAFTSNFLSNMGFLAPASTMSLGQMSEIIFMLLVPFFLRKLGVKYMILGGMLAWVVRYALFAFGAPDQIVWMLFLGILLHGVCYDFFFVTGFMYTDRVSDKEIKGQSQSMLVFFTQGIGMYIGYQVAFSRFGAVGKDYSTLDTALKAAHPEESLTFVQSLGRMFSVERLTADPAIVSAATSAWKSFWLTSALMAGVVAILFALLFRDGSVKAQQKGA
ncbi:MAG TPA: MFS transporter [Fibrobacteres bacterium]|jgi:nucleoside transporter|nr:MFS transporter [Fibrobacterota bacterium]